MLKKFIAVVCSATIAFVFVAGCATGSAARMFQASAVQDQETDSETQTVDPAESEVAEASTEPHPGLLDPSLAVEQAPGQYRVLVKTTKGNFVIEVNRTQAPNGADRFYNLVKIGFFKNIGIFRAIDGFMFQFGIHGDPEISAAWSEATIPDDEYAGVTNAEGTLTFARMENPDSRSTQLFVNLNATSNDGLDEIGFTPFGAVVEGMEAVRSINTEYGENQKHDNVQGMLKAKGNEYLADRFPNLDYINSITLIEDWPVAEAPKEPAPVKEGN